MSFLKKIFNATTIAYLFLMVASCPVLYTISHRTKEDYLYSWLGLSVLALIFICVSIVFDKNYVNEDGDTGIDTVLTGGQVFAALLVGFMVYSILVCINDAFIFFWKPEIKHERFLVAGGIIALVGGAILYYFRFKFRATYGISEALVGVLVAGQRFSEISEREANFSFFIVFLTAGIYLVVRGMDNIHQGITKEPIDPLAKLVFKIKMK